MTSEDAFVIRIGLPEFNGTLLRTALTLTNKLLVSAGRFWRQGRMLSPGRAITSDRILSCPAWTGSLNVALDSAGFSAMRELSQHPRAASMDSMAWDSRARNAVRHEGEEGSVQQRAAHMVAWYRQQLAYLRPVQVREQRGLFNV